MTNIGKKLAAEACKICEEISDALKKAHHAAHQTAEHEALQAVQDVDATERRVAALVPHGENLIPDPTRYRMGEGGAPVWHPDQHVNSGVPKPYGGVSGYHRRLGGMDTGFEQFDETSRVELPNGAYKGRWTMTDASGRPAVDAHGNVMRKPSTFFPDDWTQADIDAAVAEAWHHAKEQGDVTSNGFVGIGGGHVIRGWFKDGKVITAHPDYDEWGL